MIFVRRLRHIFVFTLLLLRIIPIFEQASIEEAKTSVPRHRAPVFKAHCEEAFKTFRNVYIRFDFYINRSQGQFYCGFLQIGYPDRCFCESFKGRFGHVVLSVG